MKKLLLKLWVISFVVILLPATGELSAEETFTKTIKKEYQVNKNALLSVNNKFGKIHCTNWDKSEISIEVTISVETSSEQKASKLFDKINIEMSGSSNHVKAVTVFKSGFSKDNDNLEIQVDYMIYMPESLSVELENKFGDIFLEEVTGEASISLSYGNMEVKKLANGSNELDIRFSNAEIGYIESANLDIKYSNFTLEETQAMNIDSKFSTMIIETIIDAGIDSQYDSWEIGAVGMLSLDTKFSGFKISKLKRSAVIDSEYGGIKIKYIPAGFDEIIIENSFGDVYLGIDEEASYQLDAEMKFGSLDYPDENEHINHKVEGYTTNLYRGTIGTDTNPTSKISIESKNAGVTIKAW